MAREGSDEQGHGGGGSLMRSDKNCAERATNWIVLTDDTVN